MQQLNFRIAYVTIAVLSVIICSNFREKEERQQPSG